MTAQQPRIIFQITGQLSRDDLPDVYERMYVLLRRSGTVVVYCDVRGLCADAVAIDALAHLHLAARRHSCEIRLQGASAELCDLIAFMGLQDIFAK